MKIMETVRSQLNYVGMRSHQAIKGHLFNIRNLTMLFILWMYIFCCTMYLIDGATNLKDFADCMYFNITGAATALNFAFINWKMAKIFRFMDNLEDIVNSSKCQIKMNLILFVVNSFIRYFFSIGLMNPTLKTIYRKTNEEIKKVHKILNFALVKSTPVCVTIPVFIASFVAYFTTDLGTEAFELPIPTMW